MWLAAQGLTQGSFLAEKIQTRKDVFMHIGSAVAGTDTHQLVSVTAEVSGSRGVSRRRIKPVCVQSCASRKKVICVRLSSECVLKQGTNRGRQRLEEERLTSVPRKA